MRTTVTLDADVLLFLQEAVRREAKSFKETLNGALREALRTRYAKGIPKLLPPRSMGFAVGIDPHRLTDLSDDLEVEEVAKHLTRQKK